MTVSAKDLATNKKQDMRILSSSGLNQDEIDEMIQDSERYRADDERRRKYYDAKNQLDGMIYNTSRNLEEFGDTLSEENDNVSIQDALDVDAEDALESSNLDVVQDAYDALYSAAQLLGEAIYQGAKSQTDAGEFGRSWMMMSYWKISISEDTFDSE